MANEIPIGFLQTIPYSSLTYLCSTQEIGGYTSPQKLIESLAHHTQFGPTREGPGFLVFNGRRLPHDKMGYPLIGNISYHREILSLAKEGELFLLQGLHRTISAVEQRMDMDYFVVSCQGHLDYLIKILRDEIPSPDNWTYTREQLRIPQKIVTSSHASFSGLLEFVNELHNFAGEFTVDDFMREYLDRFG